MRPGYTTVNLAASYDLTRAALRVFARIDNLFDRHYENPVGFLQPSLGALRGREGEALKARGRPALPALGARRPHVTCALALGRARVIGLAV